MFIIQPIASNDNANNTHSLVFFIEKNRSFTLLLPISLRRLQTKNE
jgi:hypothetical protein